MSAPVSWVNGQRVSQIDVRDRGLAYGDGLFETIRFLHGHAPLWSRHMQRLQVGARRLGIDLPAEQNWLFECRQALAGLACADAVVRLCLTRGSAERGYAPPASALPHRIVQAAAAPAWVAQDYQAGVRLHLCRTRLALAPRLAGIKHLNRLEQVLARAEWTDPGIAEGLVRDRRGRVISATAANLFARIDGQLLTPSVRRCGVAGVGRAEVLATCPQAKTADLRLADLVRAEELFLVSSVRGIVPVRAWAGQVLPLGRETRALQMHWRALGFPLPNGVGEP